MVHFLPQLVLVEQVAVEQVQIIIMELTLPKIQVVAVAVQVLAKLAVMVVQELLL